MWDLALLQVVPGIRIAAPRDAATLREELAEAVAVEDAPTVLRYPKGAVGPDVPRLFRLPDGVDVLAEAPDGSRDVLLVAVGSMATTALETAALLAAQGIGATVVDPRWVVPVAGSLIELCREHRLVVTIEDGVRVGGIGTRLRQDLREADVDTGVTELGLPDQFLDHASRNEILRDAGLDAQSIAHRIIDQVIGTRLPQARPLRERSAVGDRGDLPD